MTESLTAKQKVQRWWLKQKRHDLVHLRREIDAQIGEIDCALMTAPKAPPQTNVKDKYNHPVLAMVDNSETF